MRKVIILIILSIILSGCNLVIFDINNFVMPDDMEFMKVVESLDTPEKICQYMNENFTYKAHYLYAPDPYTLWKIKEGDCNDFADFARFIANYHGYETYRVLLYFKNTLIMHTFTVFVEDNKLTYSNVNVYCPIYVDTFEEVISHYFNTFFGYEYQSYKVYDYENNLVEEGK